MTPLVLCSVCARHFRFREARCPFCGGTERTVRSASAQALVPGASRARRYAVGAALVASGAASSCGLSTRSDPEGDAGAAVLAGAGGVAGNGGTTGGTDAGTGGLVNVAGAAGASGGLLAGSGGAAGAGGRELVRGERACPGFEERSGCRTTAECPDPRDGYYRCGAAPNPSEDFECTDRWVFECPRDTQCPSGTSCIRAICDDSRCLPACSEEDCNGDRHCVADVCVPRPCDEPGGTLCPEGFACDSTLTSNTRCAALPCTAGYECPQWSRCDPNDGYSDIHLCTRLLCEADEDCGDCGYCLEGRCAPSLGVCNYHLPAMPYGCVWPEEELV